MATAIMDDWTEEKCIQLIREFRAKPVLWDPKNPFFFKKSIKPIAWNDIAEILNIPADACKHKMVILMSSFRREKAKIMHSIKADTDSSHMYTSTWFAFKEMAFLMDKETERKRQLTGIDDDEDDGAIPSLKKTLLQHHLQAPLKGAKRVRKSIAFKRELVEKAAKTTEAKDSNQPAAEAKDSNAVQVPPTPGPSQITSESEEEIKSFTSFIATKMKKYTETTKNAVQQAICEIIFKADRNFYDSYDNFTVIDDPLDKSMHYETQIKVQTQSDSD